MLPTATLLLDDGTGTFPYDITKCMLLTSGYSFSRGRADWQGGVTAGRLSLTLNNADGRFTPGSTLIASPSPIKLDARIRLKETVNGVTTTRFTGYVKSWPVAWPAVVSSWSTVTITATDAQARAERRVLRSIATEEITQDAPSFYYTLGEPVGSTTAADTSGNQSPSLTAIGGPVTFGAAAGTTDSSTGATFANTGYLTTTNIPQILWLECAFSTSTTPISGPLFVRYGDDTLTGQSLSLYIDPTGAINGFTKPPGSGALIASGPIITDGATHVVTVIATPGVSGFLTLYVDGVSVGTSSTGIVSLPSSGPLYVGQGFTGTVSHVVGGTSITGTRLTAHASALRTGFSGEAGTARLTRLAGYANISVGTLDTSLTNVPFVDTTGTDAWPAMQDVTDAEVGLTYIDGSGNLTFQNRNRQPFKTTPDLTLTAAYVVPDAQPTTDDQSLVNYFTTTAQGTQVPQVARNATSETNHGRYDQSATYLVSTDQEALDRANWVVANFAEPTTRYGTLTINLFGMTATLAASVLAALDMGCWLRVVSMPSQNTTGTTADVVVEGYAVTVTGGVWQIACNVVSRSLFSPVWILGDTTYSVLDSTTRLFV